MPGGPGRAPGVYAKKKNAPVRPDDRSGPRGPGAIKATPVPKGKGAKIFGAETAVFVPNTLVKKPKASPAPKTFTAGNDKTTPATRKAAANKALTAQRAKDAIVAPVRPKAAVRVRQGESKAEALNRQDSVIRIRHDAVAREAARIRADSRPGILEKAGDVARATIPNVAAGLSLGIGNQNVQNDIRRAVAEGSLDPYRQLPHHLIAGAVGGHAANQPFSPIGAAEWASVIPFLRGPKAIATAIKGLHEGENAVQAARSGRVAFRESTPIMTGLSMARGKVKPVTKSYIVNGARVTVPAARSRTGRAIENALEPVLRRTAEIAQAPLARSGKKVVGGNEGHAGNELGRTAANQVKMETSAADLLKKKLSRLNDEQTQAVRLVAEQTPVAARLAFHGEQATQAGEGSASAVYHSIHHGVTQDAAKYIMGDRPGMVTFAPGTPKKIIEAYQALKEAAGKRETMLEIMGNLTNERAAARVFAPTRIVHGARWKAYEEQIQTTLENSPARKELIAAAKQQDPENWQHLVALQDAAARSHAEKLGTPLAAAAYYAGTSHVVHDEPTLNAYAFKGEGFLAEVKPDQAIKLGHAIDEHWANPEIRASVIQEIKSAIEAAPKAKTPHTQPVPPMALQNVERFADHLITMMKEGAMAKHWYTDSGKAIIKEVGGDKVQARKLAGLIASFSPQNAVYPNVKAAVEFWNYYKKVGPEQISIDLQAAKEGGKVHAWFPKRDSKTGIPEPTAKAAPIGGIVDNGAITKALKIMSGAEPSEVLGGRKITSFYSNFLQEFDPAHFKAMFPGEDPKFGKVTFDTWMRRAWGYHKSPARMVKGVLKEGEAITEHQYAFGEQVTQAIARATGWKPHEIQAAIWTSIKSRIEGGDFGRGGAYTVKNALKSVKTEDNMVLHDRVGTTGEATVGDRVTFQDPNGKNGIMEGNIVRHDAGTGKWLIRTDTGAERLVAKEAADPGVGAIIGAYVPRTGAHIYSQRADVTTFAHEMAHHMRVLMDPATEKQVASSMGAKWIPKLDSAGQKIKGKGSYEWSREAEEKFAENVLRVLRDGHAPNVPGLRNVFRNVAKELRDSFYLYDMPDAPTHVMDAIRNMFHYSKIDVSRGSIVGAEHIADSIIGQSDFMPIYTTFERGVPVGVPKPWQNAQALTTYAHRATQVFAGGRAVIGRGPQDKALINQFKGSALLSGFHKISLKSNADSLITAAKLSLAHRMRPVLLAASTDIPHSIHDIPIKIDPRKGSPGELAKLSDMLDSLGTNEISTDALNKVGIDLAQKFSDNVFPSEVGGLPAHEAAGKALNDQVPIDNIRWVPQTFIHETMLKHEISTASNYGGLLHVAGVGFDVMNDLARAGILFLSPFYAPVNLIGNLAMNAIHQGVFMPSNLMRSAFLHRELEKGDRLFIDKMMGHGMSAAMAPSVLMKKPGGALAHYLGLAVDLFPRRSAWLHEAARQGYRDPAKMRKLIADAKLGNPHATNEVDLISRRANDAIVDYERMSPFEKNVMTRLLFVYPWLRGATRYTMRFTLDHPMQAAALALMADYAYENANEKLGDRPGYAIQQLPFGTSSVGARIPGVGGVGLKDLGVSKETNRTINLRQVFTQTTPMDLALSANGFATGEDASPLANMLTPVLKAAGVTLYGKDPFTGQTVDPTWKTFFSQLVNIPIVKSYKNITMSANERDKANLSRLNPRSKTDDIMKTLLSSLYPVAYNKNVGTGLAAKSKGSLANLEFKLRSAARDVGVHEVPQAVLTEMVWKHKLDSATGKETTYVGRLDALTKVLAEEFKNKNFLQNKTDNEYEAQKMYEQLRAFVYPNLAQFTKSVNHLTTEKNKAGASIINANN